MGTIWKTTLGVLESPRHALAIPRARSAPTRKNTGEKKNDPRSDCVKSSAPAAESSRASRPPPGKKKPSGHFTTDLQGFARCLFFPVRWSVAWEPPFMAVQTGKVYILVTPGRRFASFWRCISIHSQPVLCSTYSKCKSIFHKPNLQTDPETYGSSKHQPNRHFGVAQSSTPPPQAEPRQRQEARQPPPCI